MEKSTNIPYVKSDYYDDKGNLIKDKPIPYFNDGVNRSERREYLHSKGGGKSWLYVLQTGKYRVYTQFIHEVIKTIKRQTWNSKYEQDNGILNKDGSFKKIRYRTYKLYGKLINTIKHSVTSGNLSK